MRGSQPTSMARRDISGGGQPHLKGLPGGQTSRALPPLAEKKEGGSKIKTSREKSKQRYSQIPTRSGPRPVVPAGRPLGPQPPQALLKVAPTPALVPLPPRTPEASKGQPTQASPWPRGRPPVQLAWTLARGRQADRPDPPVSPQLPRPRGQVPPRSASAPRARATMFRLWALMVPAHLGASSVTPGPASGLG